MRFSKFFLKILAANLLAAFLLHGNSSITPTFLSGTVESIDPNDDGPSAINIVKLSRPIEYNHLVASGVSSRCELNIDEVIFRLGSLTVVQWPDKNTISLNSGSIVICSEKSIELNIHSRSSQSIFVGSGTIIIESLENGGFKFIPLEVKGTLSTSKGGTIDLTGGRMLLILESPSYFGDAYDIDLMLLLRSSMLINAFPTPLPTFNQIGLAVYIQELKMKGKYDALIGDAPTAGELEIWRFGEAKE